MVKHLPICRRSSKDSKEENLRNLESSRHVNWVHGYNLKDIIKFSVATLIGASRRWKMSTSKVNCKRKISSKNQIYSLIQGLEKSQVENLKVCRWIILTSVRLRRVWASETTQHQKVKVGKMLIQEPRSSSKMTSSRTTSYLQVKKKQRYKILIQISKKSNPKSMIFSLYHMAVS